MILVIDNYDSFTYNLVHYVGDCGAEVVVRRNDDIDVRDALDLQPEKIIISPGPCTPKEAGISEALILASTVPVLGVCLGHQILALALGAKTEKMKLGHRGANHPVKNLIDGKVEITSQNHGFEVVKKGLPKNIRVTHQSLFDNSIEGIELKNKPVFSVQYHPESNPGPQDSVYLFDKFVKSMKKNAKKKRY